MKHLKLFEIESDYTNVKDDLEYPTVSYVEENDSIFFKLIENYIIATYNISTTSATTRVLGGDFPIDQVERMYVDDTEITPSETYQFDSSGEHQVKIVFKNSFNSAYFMFDSCTSLTSLDLSNFDTSNVIYMSAMFYGCSGLTSLDLSNFDTSNVTGMANMFYGCSSLTSLDLSNFDTSNVISMSGMFGGCSGLTSLDLSSFDTSNVIYMSAMFSSCANLTSITMMGDVSKVGSTGAMFGGTTTTGTFYYNSSYDYSTIITALPSTWTAVAI